MSQKRNRLQHHLAALWLMSTDEVLQRAGWAPFSKISIFCTALNTSTIPWTSVSHYTSIFRKDALQFRCLLVLYWKNRCGGPIVWYPWVCLVGLIKPLYLREVRSSSTQYALSTDWKAPKRRKSEGGVSLSFCIYTCPYIYTHNICSCVYVFVCI